MPQSGSICPWLCTWNIAVARCYVMERAAIARMGGAKTGHIKPCVDRDGLLCRLWEFVQQKVRQTELAKMCSQCD